MGKWGGEGCVDLAVLGWAGLYITPPPAPHFICNIFYSV